MSIKMLTGYAKYFNSSQLESITLKTKVIFRYDVDNKIKI